MVPERRKEERRLPSPLPTSHRRRRIDVEDNGTEERRKVEILRKIKWSMDTDNWATDGKFNGIYGRKAKSTPIFEILNISNFFRWECGGFALGIQWFVSLLCAM